MTAIDLNLAQHLSHCNRLGDLRDLREELRDEELRDISL